MATPFENRENKLRQPLLVALMIACVLGCAKPGDEQDRADQTDPARSNLPSASHLLWADHTDKFRPGRSIDDVLKDVRWRGDLQEATVHEGKSVCSIQYMLLPSGATDGDRGEWLLAIFTDGKFEKFVKPPTRAREDIVYRYEPNYQRELPYPKPAKVGDCKYLIRAVESEPVDIVKLQKELNAKPVRSYPIDPGLTALALAFKPISDAQWDSGFRKNAALRDQFNASRIRIGMTEEEVESVLKAKPLETGKVDAGAYKIYGSNESAHTAHYDFRNILVVFRDGKVTGLHSTPSGYQWRRKLGERYLDLPMPKR